MKHTATSSEWGTFHSFSKGIYTCSMIPSSEWHDLKLYHYLNLLNFYHKIMVLVAERILCISHKFCTYFSVKGIFLPVLFVWTKCNCAFVFIFIALQSQLFPNVLQVFTSSSQDYWSSTYVCKNWVFKDLWYNCTTPSREAQTSSNVSILQSPKWDRCNSIFSKLYFTLQTHSYTILVIAPGFPHASISAQTPSL